MTKLKHLTFLEHRVYITKCTLSLQATQIVSRRYIVCTQQRALGLLVGSTGYVLETGNINELCIYMKEKAELT